MGSFFDSGGSGLISSVVSGAFGLIGNRKTNKANLKATRETNQANMQIAQMNNEFNEREAAKNRQFQSDEASVDRDWQSNEAAINRSFQTSEREAQNQFALDQWNRENEYNTPAAQRARLEEAGINPYNMAIDTGSAGSISGTGTSGSGSMGSGSAASGSPTAPASQVQMLPAHFDYDFSSVANAINSYYQNQKTAAETVGIGQSNALVAQFGSDETLARIAGLLNGDWSQITPEYIDTMRQNGENMAMNKVDRSYKENAALDSTVQLQLSQALNTSLQADAQQIRNSYLDQEQQLQLNVMAADAFMKMTSGQLNQQTVKNRIQEQFKTMAETQGIKIANKTASRLADAYVSAMREEYQANENYFKSYKMGAGQAAVNDLQMSNIDRQMSKFQLRMAEMQKEMTEGSWKYRSSGYRNFTDFWRDYLGALLSGAGAGVGNSVFQNATRVKPKTGFGFIKK